MSVVAGIVLGAFAVLLIAFTVTTFAKPAIAERFVSAFASSARAHYVEQVCRSLVGAALIVRSPMMRQSQAYSLVGWAVVVSASALLCLPWRWHQRFAERVRPLLVRRLRLYALGAFAFGAVLLYGLIAGCAAE